ncbi:PAS domain S-box protein [Scytonema sp. UIC 10036]|uniref:sensor histidine kinase n=1 Tax=Scytonema sp. UIC 10036 TaxID=2304196 RepID=UPI0012DAA276|nr:histidine kinase dimerization/phosphoacceptor domain -containing protein [Scytonema sp. UIC 10036]MUH00862.1 PAS domain S-box protein [Scytonema sp. UIC 10036]
MFAIAFGTSNLIEVWTLWHSGSWSSSVLKILAAIISVVLGVRLVSVLPKPQTSPDLSQLEKLRDELEARFQQQIADLIELNKSLQAEITEYKQRVAFLQESEARFRLIAYTAPVMIWVSDIERLCNYFNKVWLEFTGRTIQQEIGYGWLESVHPEDKERCFLTRTTAFDARLCFKMEYRLRRKDGEYRWILDTGIPHYRSNNIFAGYIGSCVDITEHKQAEEQIQASLLEKDVLLKEIYHRVKNNLQVISSLLNLQSEYIKDKDDLEIFQQSQMRIESMALIHQKLYQSQDLARIDFGEYIRDLVASLFSSYEVNTNVISLTVNVERVLLSLDAAIPCGLIITELVSNSLKYAFPKGRTGEISIQLQAENNILNLRVCDNGVGLPAEVDLKNTTSLGLQLVDALTNQLSGDIKINYTNGVEVKITFQMLEKNLNWRKK